MLKNMGIVHFYFIFIKLMPDRAYITQSLAHFVPTTCGLINQNLLKQNLKVLVQYYEVTMLIFHVLRIILFYE
jgi:hypothetical protein